LNIESVNEEERTVEAVIATEDPVTVFDFGRYERIDEILLMSGVKFPMSRQLPLLDAHNRWSVGDQLGSTRNIRVEDDKLVGTNYFSTTPSADAAFSLIKEKHLTDNSVGYRVKKYTTIEPGQKAKVAGRLFTANKGQRLRITTDWEVVENSVVAIGADKNAKNRSDNNDGRIRSLIMKGTITMKFEEWLKKRGFDVNEMTDDQISALRSDYDAETAREQSAAAGAGQVGDDEQLANAHRKGKEEERNRRDAIRKLAGDDIDADLVDRCIEQNLSVEESQRQMLEHLRAKNAVRTGGPAIVVRDAAAATEDLQNGVLLRAGGEFEKGLEKEKDADQKIERAKRFRDVSLTEMCRMALQIDGVEPPIGRNEMIHRAMSTYTLPQLLGAVANKALLAGYNAAPASWRAWCNIGSVPNFQTQTRIRLTDTGGLTEVPNSGEVGHGTQQEEYEQFNAKTYAKQFGITRKDIINDNIGAFTSVPQKMGQKAQNRISQLVYEHFMANGSMTDDSVACFHANHSNLNTSNALDHDGLKAALIEFDKQTDKDSELLDIPAAWLIVPVDLKVVAQELMKSKVMLYGADDESKIPAANVFEGTLGIVADPRLSNSAYTNYSATTWYLSASPSQGQTLEVSFLNGKQTPTIERFANDPNILGVVFRVYIDVATKVLDFRTMSKNTA